MSRAIREANETGGLVELSSVTEELDTTESVSGSVMTEENTHRDQRPFSHLLEPISVPMVQVTFSVPSNEVKH